MQPYSLQLNLYLQRVRIRYIVVEVKPLSLAKEWRLQSVVGRVEGLKV